jgi:hypothetical protein
MEKVTYRTEHILLKANTDSEWDDCTFAIIYLTEQWRQLLAERASWLIPCKKDSSFFSLTYWDSHIAFFIHTGDDQEDALYGSDLMEEDEIWSYVSVTEDELDRFKRPENKICVYQLRIMSDGYAQFQAWGDHTHEKFYTEQFELEPFINPSTAIAPLGDIPSIR